MNLFVFSILASTNEALKIRDIAPAVESLSRSNRFYFVFWILAILIPIFIFFFYHILIRRKKRIDPLEQLIEQLKDVPTDSLQRVHMLSQILRKLVGIAHGKSVEGWTVQEILPLLSEEENETRKILLSADAFRFSHEIPDDFPAYFKAHIEEKIAALREKEALCD